jgi:ADP-ribosylglycohydrolase
MNTRHRIRAALTGFACGDAAGVPWETMRPEQIEPRRIPSLPDRRGWPRGSVSDDTIFLLSVADVIASGSATPRSLLERLAADLPRARGAGRTSRAAVERFLAHGTLHATGGATNGAAMRALPIGWASSVGQAERRVRLGVDLARTTHGEPSAIAAAVAVAAMGAWSIEGVPIHRIIDQALSETRLALDLLGAPPALMTPIESAANPADPLPSTQNHITSTEVLEPVHANRQVGPLIGDSLSGVSPVFPLRHSGKHGISAAR